MWPRDILDCDRHPRASSVRRHGAAFDRLAKPAILGRARDPSLVEGQALPGGSHLIPPLIVIAELDPAIARGYRDGALFAPIFVSRRMAGSSPAMTE
jgi:hypothetical protein